jgi:hypothetical protein
VRKWQSNRGMLHCFVPERAPRATPRAPTATSPGPDAEAAYHPPVRASWGRPRRTAIPTLSLCATCSRPLRRPPNGVAAVRAQRRPWLAIGRHASPPILAHTTTLPRLLALVCKEALNRLERAIKPAGLLFRARPARATAPRH